MTEAGDKGSAVALYTETTALRYTLFLYLGGEGYFAGMLQQTLADTRTTTLQTPGLSPSRQSQHWVSEHTMSNAQPGTVPETGSKCRTASSFAFRHQRLKGSTRISAQLSRQEEQAIACPTSCAASPLRLDPSCIERVARDKNTHQSAMPCASPQVMRHISGTSFFVKASCATR